MAITLGNLLKKPLRKLSKRSSGYSSIFSGVACIQMIRKKIVVTDSSILLAHLLIMFS
jgi:hypothetical protein